MLSTSWSNNEGQICAGLSWERFADVEQAKVYQILVDLVTNLCINTACMYTPGQSKVSVVYTLVCSTGHGEYYLVNHH